jgi:hypothetical protein
MGAAGLGGSANLQALAGQIRKMMAKGAVVMYIPHARKEMIADHVTATDVEFALRGCWVVRRELHGTTNDWRTTCRGRTRQGNLIEISVRVFEEENKIQAVTVYKVV